MPDTIYCANEIIKKDNLPFRFAKKFPVDLTKFESIRIDSILMGEARKTFHMLDDKTFDLLMNNRITDTFDIFLNDDYGGFYIYFRVVAFDSAWNSDYFMAQFSGYSEYIKTIEKDTEDFFKQRGFWEYYRDVLKKNELKMVSDNLEEGIRGVVTENLPKKIREAVEKNKILIFLLLVD